MAGSFETTFPFLVKSIFVTRKPRLANIFFLCVVITMQNKLLQIQAIVDEPFFTIKDTKSSINYNLPRNNQQYSFQIKIKTKKKKKKRKGKQQLPSVFNTIISHII